ncbi:ABC transporter substrate-binding protein [Frankia gtarii]|uniref:ABC transporter substrate-binding protein n=1 Tax=Frankia gtarii TaxID=2950102 RepID=UPI0021C08421|nr:ABC transporter substrate-binding protein [Frankia gtarii]
MAAATMLVACSSGGVSDASQKGACAPGVTNDSIKAGILYPDTGVMGTQFSGYRAGVTARFAEQNAAGGVDGRKINYIWQDDQSDSGGSLQGARTLVGEGAFAVLEYTSFSQGSAQYLDDQHIPVVGVADQPLWGDHDNMFTYTFVTDAGRSTTTLADFVRQQGGTKAALVVTYLTEASKLYAAGVRQSLENAGIPVIQDDIDSTNATDVARKIIGAGADTVIAASPLDLYTGVLDAAVSAGHPVKVAVSAVSYDPRVVAAYGKRLVGTYSQLTFAALERNLPAQRRFLQAMAAYSPEIQPAGQNSAIAGYINADMFIRGLKTQQGCPTRESYMRGMRSITDYDADGMMVQKINMTADHGELDRCSDFVRIAPTGDRFEVVNPQPLCGQRIGNG